MKVKTALNALSVIVLSVTLSGCEASPSGPDTDKNDSAAAGFSSDIKDAIVEKHYCEVKALDKIYYSFGRTELDARIKTQLFCQEGNGNNAVYCHDNKISCRINK